MGLRDDGRQHPAGPQWKTMDGSFITMTQTLAGQVFAAAAASDAALFARAEQIKATMDADPVAFDLAAHAWPVVFGETCQSACFTPRSRQVSSAGIRLVTWGDFSHVAQIDGPKIIESVFRDGCAEDSLDNAIAREPVIGPLSNMNTTILPA